MFVMKKLQYNLHHAKYNSNNLNKNIKQLFLGLKSIHAIKCIHGDIKTNNIMIDEDENIVYIDLGAVRMFGKRYKQEIVSLWFRPPELIEIKEQPDKWQGFLIQPSIDIWSLGCVIYFLIYRKFLFITASSRILLQKIKKRPKITGKYGELLERMLEYDPTKRITIDEALAML